MRHATGSYDRLSRYSAGVDRWAGWLGVDQDSGRCPGKTSAHDFCACFHELALLRRLESGHEVTFHVEDGRDLIAGKNGDRYLRFHQVRGLNIARVIGNI